MRTLTVLAAVLALAVFVIPAYCAETKGAVTKITPVGEIVEISVKDDTGKETIYELYKETKVLKGGKEVTIGDILVEDEITINKKGDVVEIVEIAVIPEAPVVTTRSGAPVTTKTGVPVTAMPAEEKE